MRFRRQQGQVTPFRIAAVAAAVIVSLGAWSWSASDQTHADPVMAARAHQLTLIEAGAVSTSVGDQFDLDLAAREESLISQCMGKAGLSYAPKDPHSLVDTTSRSDFTSLAYAQQHGFGISTWPDPVLKQAMQAGAVPPDTAAHRAYVAQQSTCSDRANKTAAGEFGISAAKERYTQLDGLVRKQTTYHSAEKAWVSCAAAKGVAASSRLALITSLRARYAGVLKNLETERPVGSIDDLAAASATDPGFQAFKADEIKAATATFPCSQAFDATYVELFLHADQTTAP